MYVAGMYVARSSAHSTIANDVLIVSIMVSHFALSSYVYVNNVCTHC